MQRQEDATAIAKLRGSEYKALQKQWKLARLDKTPLLLSLKLRGSTAGRRYIRPCGISGCVCGTLTERHEQQHHHQQHQHKYYHQHQLHHPFLSLELSLSLSQFFLSFFLYLTVSLSLIISHAHSLSLSLSLCRISLSLSRLLWL